MKKARVPRHYPALRERLALGMTRPASILDRDAMGIAYGLSLIFAYSSRSVERLDSSWGREGIMVPLRNIELDFINVTLLRKASRFGNS